MENNLELEYTEYVATEVESDEELDVVYAMCGLFGCGIGRI